jgi:hypothetical protein
MEPARFTGLRDHSIHHAIAINDRNGMFLARNRPPGWNPAPRLPSNDLLGLIDATSNV